MEKHHTVKTPISGFRAICGKLNDKYEKIGSTAESLYDIVLFD